MLRMSFRRGYTLLELVAVMVLSAMLTAFGAFSYLSLVDTAKSTTDLVSLVKTVDAASAANAWTAGATDPLFPLGVQVAGDWTDGLATHLVDSGFVVVPDGDSADVEGEVSLSGTRGAGADRFRTAALLAESGTACVFMVVDFDANVATSVEAADSRPCEAGQVQAPGSGELAVTLL